MLKHRNRLLTAAGAAAAAGATVISGVTAAGAASSSASRIEHFQFMEAAISPTTTVIAHGAFTASGVDHTGDSIDTIVFSAGTFKFRHSPGKGPTRFNAKTCLGSENQHGKYKIFGGTGSYKGISGHGTYHLNLLFVAARNANGSCSHTKEPTGFQLVVRASGPVHL